MKGVPGRQLEVHIIELISDSREAQNAYPLEPLQRRGDLRLGDPVDAFLLVAGSMHLKSWIYVELGGNGVRSPIESYGVDGVTGLVVRQGAALSCGRVEDPS